MLDPSAADLPSTSDNRSSLIKEYERKLNKFLSDPKIVGEVSQRIYSKELIQLVRDIVKIFQIVPCPIPEKELQRIGIDRGPTMPSSVPVNYKKYFTYMAKNDPAGLIKYNENKPAPQIQPYKRGCSRKLFEERNAAAAAALNSSANTAPTSVALANTSLSSKAPPITTLLSAAPAKVSPTSTEHFNELTNSSSNNLDSTARISDPSNSDLNEKPNVAATVSSTIDHRPSLMEEYERKLDKLLSDPKIVEEVSQQIYNRELIQLLREIIATFHTVPCPVSEAELRRITIDRKTMPPSKAVDLSYKKKVLQKEKRSRAKTVSSNERFRWNQKPVKLRKCQNPWKPSFFPNMHLTQTEKITREIRGVLNKLSPSTFDRFSTVILRKHIWNNLETLPAIVEVIFSKAIEDQVYVEMFADLCLDLYYAEENVAFNQCNFLSALARQCQIGLNSIVHGYGNEFAELEKKIATEYEKKKEKLLKENLEEMKAVKKWRSVGILRFIAHLCQVPVLSFQTIQNCINLLINASQKSESNFTTMIGFMIFLINLVGPYFARNDSSDEYVTTLNQFVEYLEEQKPLLPSRMKYLVMNLSTLRDNGWKKVYVAPIQMNEEDEMNFDEELLIAYKIHG